jgi:Secretion system C-terminal sorting domain/FG-GAP-like repeat
MAAFPNLVSRAFCLPHLLLGALGVLLAQYPAQAQLRYGLQFADGPKVVIGSDTLRDPWVGGFNSVTFNPIDLNADGVKDLYVHDHTTQRGLTYVATNGPSGWYWRHEPAYEGAFPEEPVLNVLLRDFDGDGREDFFAVQDPQYWILYRNVAVPGGVGFQFQPVTFRLKQTVTGGGTRAIATSVYGKQTMEDVDGDGDFDILDYAYALDVPDLYRNITPPGATEPLFEEMQEWGDFVRCARSPQGCHQYAFSGTSCRAAQPAHGANVDYSLLAADLDGDGDKELLVGQQYCRDLALLTNEGTAAMPQFSRLGLVVPYPTGPPAASMVHTPGAFYQDVTFDGQPDLLVTPWLTGQEEWSTPFSGDQYETRETAWLYPRTGPGISAFRFQQTNFLQDQMLDLGNQAAPTLGDLDGDGDLDLLVGNMGDLTFSGPPVNTFTSYRGKLRFYRNVGTPQRAIFKLEDNDFGRFSALDKRALVPVLTDLDGNGRLDLVLRCTTGRYGEGVDALKYFLDTTSTGQLAGFSRATERTFRFNQTRGYRDLPVFVDADGDGDRDILLGSMNNSSTGTINFIENRGGRPDTAFKLNTTLFGALPGFVQHPAPAVLDLDGDGRNELITATDDGEIRVWPDALSTPAAPLTGYGNLVRNNISTVFGAARMGTRPVLTTGDLDGDGRAEILVGTGGGGVRLLRSQPNGINGLHAASAAPATTLSVWPNPAANELHVSALSTRNPSLRIATVTLTDLLGRSVLQASGSAESATQTTLDISAVLNGVYLLRATFGNGTIAQRRVVISR